MICIERGLLYEMFHELNVHTHSRKTEAAGCINSLVYPIKAACRVSIRTLLEKYLCKKNSSFINIPRSCEHSVPYISNGNVLIVPNVPALVTFAVLDANVGTSSSSLASSNCPSLSPINPISFKLCPLSRDISDIARL